MVFDLVSVIQATSNTGYDLPHGYGAGMVTILQVRGLALGLAEAVEQPHHGFPSFRVAGKVFATLPDEEHLNVMVDPDEVGAAVAEAPAACEELWWGKRLSGVRVRLAGADAGLVGELLADAWRRKAPRRLLTD